MATRAVSTVIYYRAWNTSTNAAVTGDSANHTLKWIKDGTASSTTNSPSEVDSTNAPGIYKVTMTSTETDCTYGALAGKSSTSNVSLFGVQVAFEYAASAAFPSNFGSLSIDGSGRVDVGKVGGTAQTARDIGASVLLSAGTGTGQLDFTSGVVKANLAQILGTALTETSGQIAAAFKKFFNIATPASTMDSLTLVATATNLTNAPTSGDLTSTMKTSVATAVLDAALSSHTTSGSVGAGISSASSAGDPWSTALPGSYTSGHAGYIVGTFLDAAVSSRLATSGYTSPPTAAQNASAVLTTQMTEGYAADGSPPTLTQGVMLIQQALTEKVVEGTSCLVKKLDGSTTAVTLTLNDSASPTSITRTG